MIPIDEQIVHQRKVCDFRKENVSILNVTVPDVQESILASLQRLKAIYAVQVPEEPKIIGLARKAIADGMVAPLNRIMLEHIDTLRDLLKRADVNNREVGTILMGDNLKLTFDGATGELKSAEEVK